MNIGEEKILEFLDGRLATPDEEELLHTLAVSPERREVLRAHINLRQMTSSLAREEQFSVPERLTNQLFERLNDMGYEAPAGAEDILTRAPEFVSSRVATGIAEGVGVAALAGEAGLSSGWRFGMISILTASLVSFILGAGAYYVFGSALGLRTHSQEIAAIHSTKHIAKLPAPVEQYTIVAAHVPTIPLVSLPKLQEVFAASSQSSPVASDVPNVQENAPAITTKQHEISDAPLLPAIGFTAPRDPMAGVSVESPRSIPTIELWPDAIPSPLAQDHGTISVRFGVGPAPEATDAPMTTLSEFRFGWKMGYFVGAASMGQLNSIERTAQTALKDPSAPSKGLVISTPENSTPISSTLIGLDAGITLDPIGVPVDAMVGFMYSGANSSDYSTFYDRASLTVHFEPWREMTVSGGIEAMWYSHDLTRSINDQKAFNKPYPPPLSASAVTRETCGLVGPTLEFGWHF